MKQSNIGAIIGLLFIVTGFYGYINNIVHIWDCNTTSCRTVRVIGAMTTVPGAIMGFIDFK